VASCGAPPTLLTPMALPLSAEDIAQLAQWL
jgi:hypothetical protein